MDDGAYRPLIQSTAAHAEEQGATRVRTGQGRPAVAQPLVQSAVGGLSVRHGPFLCALAENAQHSPPAINVVDVQPDQLRDPDAARVQQLEHQPVAQHDRFRRLGVIGGDHELGRFVRAQDGREMPPWSRAREQLPDIGVDQPGPVRPRTERP